VVTGRTAELIARSRLVLTHVSTAVGIAAILKKPMMVIATADHYRLTPAYPEAFDQLCRTLGTSLHMIDAPGLVDLGTALRMDADCLDRYAGKYLRHPQAPEGRLWDIVFGRVVNALASRERAAA
jgi:hypothetical protein